MIVRVRGTSSADEVIVVRQVTAADGAVLRALRLEALADTPTAYLETLEQALALDAASWTAMALRGSKAGSSHQVVALDGDRAVATTIAFQDAGATWLAGVYVTPTHRGIGLLARTLEPCAAWARERGARELRLEVHEDNARARAAYARLGFAPTGERRPYPLGPDRDELVMALPLPPPYPRAMTEDAGFAIAPNLEAPPPSLLTADPSHVAYDERRDPLDLGFVLLGGVLAPLPPRVRLPHEDDEGEEVLV